MASKRIPQLLSASLLVPLLVHAAGQSKTGQIQVSVTIVGECNVITPQPLNFGVNLSAGFNSPATATAQIEVNCAANTPFTIALDQGQGTGATVATRVMQSGAEKLNYGIFSDAAHNVVWGNTVGQTVSGIGTGVAQSIPVYGQIPVPTTAPKPGAYSDTVTATLTY